MASFQFRRGTNGLGMSIQYHNIVPEMDSPIFEVWSHFYGDILDGKLMTIEALESAQRNILALYRDGHSSPSDRTERDMSHSEVNSIRSRGRDISADRNIDVCCHIGGPGKGRYIHPSGSPV
jgi:hypothetical protein